MATVRLSSCPVYCPKWISGFLFKRALPWPCSLFWPRPTRARSSRSVHRFSLCPPLWLIHPLELQHVFPRPTRLLHALFINTLVTVLSCLHLLPHPCPRLSRPFLSQILPCHHRLLLRRRLPS